MEKSFFRNNIISILAHISAWGVFLSIPIILRNREQFTQIHEFNENGLIVFGLLLIVVFYINFLILVPRLLNRFGIHYYGLAITSLLFMFIGLLYIIKIFVFHNNNNIPLIKASFPFLFVITMGLSIRLLLDRTSLERDIKERENETLKSELSFLRSQISPHFLFNVMNNVVSLSRLRPHLVEPTLIQLSQLMRYMLYGSDEKKVTIQNEIKYLQSYIDLQNMRFSDSIKVIFEKNLDNTEGVLEPMLLIPFVENAFKHGVGSVITPKINVYLEVKNNELSFNVSNIFDSNVNTTKNDVSGIGLKNVSRRLELLYPQQHSLIINKNDEWFDVKLKINLNRG